MLPIEYLDPSTALCGIGYYPGPISLVAVLIAIPVLYPVPNCHFGGSF